MPPRKKSEKVQNSGDNGGDENEDLASARFGDEEPFLLEVGLRGVSPFFFNRMDIESYETENPVGGKRRPRKRPSYDSMVWRMDGDASPLALPTINVVRAMVWAGRYYVSPMTRNPRHSASSTLAEALVPMAEYTQFAPNQEGDNTWDAIDFRQARYGDTKRTPKPTYRPRLEVGWLLGPEEGQGILMACQLPELYSPAKLLEILTKAGQVAGVGDGRKIGMGRFVIAWSKVTEGVAWD